MGNKWSDRIVTICLLIGIACSVGSACREKVVRDEVPLPSETVLPEDFITFYRQFHSDSLFQLRHITFPLSVTVQVTAGRDSTITWTPENWMMHRKLNPDDGWSVDFTMPLEDIIIEFIYADGFWMERRFSKTGHAWNLIYYSGLRQQK